MYWNRETIDIDRPADEHGYIQSNVGDSGSPYWTKTQNGQDFVVAIVQGFPKTKPGGFYGAELEMGCRNYATKITKDMVKWLWSKHDYIVAKP